MSVETQDITIRASTKQDLDALSRLYFDLHEFHVRGVPDRLLSLGEWDSYDSTQLRASLDKIMTDELAVLLVAERNGSVLGMAEAYLKEDIPNPVRLGYSYAHLQSLMVSTDERRSGIGRMLMEAVEHWAREQGAEEIRLDIWEFPEGPLRFYEVSGYETYRREMVRKL